MPEGHASFIVAATMDAKQVKEEESLSWAPSAAPEQEGVEDGGQAPVCGFCHWHYGGAGLGKAPTA